MSLSSGSLKTLLSEKLIEPDPSSKSLINISICLFNSDDKENRALVSSEFRSDTSDIAELTFMMALISSSVSKSIFDKSLETF